MNNVSLYLPMLSLFFVLALVIFGYVLVNNKKRKITENKGFQEYGRHYLTPKSYLSITKIGEKYFCLGISEHSVNLITEISSEEFVEYFSHSNATQLMDNFSEFLKNAKILEKLKNKRDVNNEKGD